MREKYTGYREKNSVSSKRGAKIENLHVFCNSCLHESGGHEKADAQMNNNSSESREHSDKQVRGYGEKKVAKAKGYAK